MYVPTSCETTIQDTRCNKNDSSGNIYYGMKLKGETNSIVVLKTVQSITKKNLG